MRAVKSTGRDKKIQSFQNKKVFLCSFNGQSPCLQFIAALCLFTFNTKLFMSFLSQENYNKKVSKHILIQLSSAVHLLQVVSSEWV